MTKYHINPDTQRALICRAKTADSCPVKPAFNETTTPHFSTKEELKKYIEINNSKNETTFTQRKTSNETMLTQGKTSKDEQSIYLSNHQSVYEALPKDFDKDASELFYDIQNKKSELDNYKMNLMINYGEPEYIKSKYTRKLKGFKLSFNQALNKAKEKSNHVVPMYEKSSHEYNTAKKRFEFLEKVYQERGSWNRTYIVPDGHIHSTTECSTLHKGKDNYGNKVRTKIEWSAELSGANEQEIINKAGYRACTICYPNAPVGNENTLPTQIYSTSEKEELQAKEEKANALAKKKADQANKAPTITGEPLMVKYKGYTLNLKTERSAQTWYIDSYNDYIKNPEEEKDRRNAQYKVLYNLALKKNVSLSDLNNEYHKKRLLKEVKSAKDSVKYLNFQLAQAKSRENDEQIAWAEKAIQENNDFIKNPSVSPMENFGLDEKLYKTPPSQWDSTVNENLIPIN